jgi:hypothetical protein
VAYGAGLPDARIDVEAIKAWGAWCDAEGLCFDAVIDAPISLADLLSRIALSGRASPTWATGKLGVVWEDRDDPAVAVFGMTESHRAMIQFAMTPVPRNLYLFREFMPQRGLKEIGDPYGGALKLYESTRDEMVEAIPSLIEFIKTQVSAKPAR